MRKAIKAINTHGALLVFPIQNQKEPASLWSEFYPRTKMRWEWDDSGDAKVSDMWSLMKQLSDCDQVVYSKWFRGRATFFSRDLFRAMLSLKLKSSASLRALSTDAEQILETLEQDSPLSTKQLKAATGLQGKFNEGSYSRAMKSLFLHLLIVAYGEVDDGAFPSLAVGATKSLFEDLWNEAQDLFPAKAQETLELYIPKGNAFRKQWDSMQP
jgi:hypothetical protein